VGLWVQQVALAQPLGQVFVQVLQFAL